MEIAGKKVVDARKSIRITISKRDAATGKTKDPGNCAAARAIVRTIVDAKNARVHLGRTYVEYPDRSGARKHGLGKTSGVRRRAHIARVHHQIEGVRAKGANK